MNNPSYYLCESLEDDVDSSRRSDDVDLSSRPDLYFLFFLCLALALDL